MTFAKIMKKMNKDKLWELRKEICLNSIMYADYENSFGLNTHDCCDFFDGYCDYICELYEEEFNKSIDDLFDVFKLDTIDNLWDFYCCFEF